MASDTPNEPEASPIQAGAPTPQTESPGASIVADAAGADVQLKTWLDEVREYKAWGIIAGIGLQLAVLIGMIVIGSLKAAR